ncbi:hypothetical protein BDV96DRAFT_156951 [Lophiotrema nucula]|uniref:NAD(P)-binding protein n=1 Tax=Lophiotrema nucula TaxID=690887 RepID=A0A6A5Z041_9PLEO|nr:hypothetical protein BDV96DRAFT_156951 [Lophiotrema nucula]
MASPIPPQAEKINPRTAPIDFTTPLDTSNLAGKSILVTGGASGIGLACVTAFASAGAFVTIADLQEDAGAIAALDLTSRGLKVQFARCNVTNFESQWTAFKSAIEFGGGRLDIVVPAAGIIAEQNLFDAAANHPVSLDAPPPPPGLSGLDVNLIGVYYSSYLALHYFRLPSPTPTDAPFKKALVFVSSMAGYTGFPESATYSMSKFGVRGLWYGTRDKGLKQDPQVRVNLVAPWFIKTPMTVIEHEKIQQTLMIAGFAPIENVVDAVLRLSVDEKIYSRAAGILPEGNLDLGDNVWEGYGGIEVQKAMGVRYADMLKKAAALQAAAAQQQEAQEQAKVA